MDNELLEKLKELGSKINNSESITPINLIFLRTTVG